MDERHWWIATKIQETFQVDETDSPTALEQFLLEPNNFDLLSHFLAANGLNKLFVYGKRPESRPWMAEDLNMVPNLVNIKGIGLNDFVCVYLLRPSIEQDVDQTHMHKQIFCGEIKNNPLHQLSTVLSQVFMPMVKAKETWGKCSDEHRQQFVHSTEKYVNMLANATSKSNAISQQILRLPQQLVSRDFTQHRISTQLDAGVLQSYEEVVHEWIQAIDGVLSEGSEDRLLDINSGPLTELERWKRRQRVLGGITEQLKSKECKNVIGVLIQAKSRVLRSWRTIDMSITDAQNETKDKVKYLEALRRHLEQLHHESNPVTAVNVVLPMLIGAIRQMDSISRFYARNGYLGLLCMKIGNQLASICRDYVGDMLKNNDLWKIIEDEIESDVTIPPSFKASKKGSKKKELIHEDDKTLIGRLRACLAMQSFYKDIVKNLKDTLGSQTAPAHSLNQSVNSLDAPMSRSKIPKRTKFAATASVVSGSDKEYGTFSYGIALHDDETILGNLDSICGRIKQFLDVIGSLRQFTKLAKDTAGLPRPRSEDIPDSQNSNDSNNDEKSAALRPLTPREPDPDSSTQYQITSFAAHGQQSMLPVPEEDEDMDDDLSSGLRNKRTKMLDSDSDLDSENSDFSYTPVQSQYNAAVFLKHIYSSEEEGPSISTLISENVASILKTMSTRITSSMLLDLHRKHKEKFEETYNFFSGLTFNLDQLLVVYLQAIFAKTMRTQQGLEILSKFSAVMQRLNLKELISEHYSNVYAMYTKEMEAIQNMYEKHKNDPILPRDAPPAAGAIYWSRQLLSHIEEPMKAFHENKSLVQNKEYHRTVKFYNKLATALVKYEALWYQQWCKSVDHALTGLKISLLKQVNGELMVNADPQILHLIQESKWMLRMKLEIPEAAKTILHREKQFKHYKIHLEQCLHDYKKVCSKIPGPYVVLFNRHIDSVKRCLQAGMNTISWDNMNIDAFLHKARSTTQRLNSIVEKVNSVVEEKIEKEIARIHDMMLFDESFVFGKTWNADELLMEMNNSISERGGQMQNSTSVIEGAIHDIIMILSSSRINSADHFQAPTYGTASKPTRKQRQNNRGGSSASSTGESKTSSQQAFEPEEMIVEKILSHYSERTYKSVLNAVCQSLAALTNALGTKPEEQIVCYHYSRPGSSHSSSEAARTSSSLSFTSHASTWDDVCPETDEEGSLKFNISIKFRIPEIVLHPPLSDVQQTIDEMVELVTTATNGILWWAGPNKNMTFESSILMNETVSAHRAALSSVTKGVKFHVKVYIHRLSQYNFLWKDDMQRTYSEFMSQDPEISALRKEVEYLLEVEKKISSVPPKLAAGSVILCPTPVKDALQGLAAAWKTQYALVLHEDAKKKLDGVVQYRNNIQSRLSAPVLTLDQLNSTLGLLEEIHDMENKIDGVYLPIESMYDKLRSYDLRLARAELQQVESLRQKWVELVMFADELGQSLVKERRTSFEQELDKQLKTFVVEVIQFRNAFDAQGPAVPGVRPAEAVQRLHDFQNRYTLYNAKRKTLDSVQRLFGIPPKPFPELVKTGEELKLLGMLYGLFQKFIAFDRKFRDTLWEGVDLYSAHNEVQGYWEECLSLPSKLKEWDAFTEMKNSINFYLDVLPLLHRLAKKGKFKDIMIPEIRNRHWLQVMSVTNSKFQLESNLFKLGHLLDIGLLKRKDEIRDITVAASKELELEVKMRGVEEEWTEQVLTFDNYKRRGPVLLIKEDSERLLEQLEDAQALLANMLTSKHIGPLREEAASWAEKLKGVGEVLDLWLETQDLWLDLEAVFSDHVTAKELPQEAKRFSMVDKSYVKLVRRAYDTKNILQCCYGGEVPKGVVLRHMQEELEICFKCLTQYLDKKRSVCPRFYFLTDPALLALLSRPNDIESVRPHLRTIFDSITDIKLEKSSAWSDTVSSIKSAQNTPTPIPDRRFTLGDDAQRASVMKYRSGMKSCDSPHLSASIADEVNDSYQATAVMASNKEYLPLDDEVSLYEGVELWLQNLQESVRRTLHNSITKAIQDIESNLPIEELAHRYPGQVARLGLLYVWTKECENAISELKWDRKAFQNASKKFSNLVSRFPIVLNRGTWRGSDDGMHYIHKLRLENMIMYSVYLRDSIDGMASKKIRERTDFEWRKSIRFYSNYVNGMAEHQILLLDAKYDYGLEFYGLSSKLVMTVSSEQAFLSMSNALQDMQGCALVGETCSGKTETVKGLAALLGKFLYLVNCSESAELSSLSKILQGLSTDGSWGCFDDVHLLLDRGISVILDFASALKTSLKSKTQGQAYISCLGAKGQLINVKSDVGLFLTFNPLAAGKSLPTSVRSLFRTIRLVKPDISSILKAHCTALGLRAPKALADRLRTLVDLSHQQIPRKHHHEVNLPAILFAANLAAQKRRAKEERIESRADPSRFGDDSKLSRSNSQTSVRQPVPQVSPSPTVTRTLVSDKVLTKKISASPNTLTSQAKIDHGLVAQSLLETISPGFIPTDYVIFNNIVRDVFSGIQYVRDVLSSMSGASPTGSTIVSSSAAKNHDLETAINQVAKEKSLVAPNNWVSKVMQVYQMAQLRQGIVIAGPAGTGKSSIISVLVDALCLLPHNHGTGRANSPGLSSHKLQRLNPMTVDDESLMFGSVNHSNEWVDGILTHAWRKANRNQSTTWLCLDGPLVSSWADHFNSALGGSKSMALSSGEKLQLTSNMRLVFETSDLKNASPPLLSRSGLVYADESILGWRPLARAWLETRTKEEVYVLQKAFNKTLDPVCAFVFNESRLKLPVCEVGLFNTCLTLLSEMLNEHQQHIGGDLHVERLFLFCLVWAYGGLLEGNAAKSFSDLLKTLSSALPDYDHEISVFDYYVDESGEWDSWMARVPEATYTGATDILGEVFVDTVDTVRVRSLLEFAHMARKHTLIIGDRGIGKTALINDFLDMQDKQSSILRRLVFSRASTATQLHNFIQHNIQHRQGFVYGARDGKYLEAFIDDVNLPSEDAHGVQRCNELLRALVDDHTICKLSKPFEWRTIEGFEVLATLSTSSLSQFNLDPRLLRHFAVFRLRSPSSSDLRNIIFSVLEANLSDRSLNQELHDCIATASCKILELVKDVLRPGPMPGRHHYAFCLRQLTKLCQCLRRLGEEDRANDLYVVSLWKYEMERLVGDQLCRTSDIFWFEEQMTKITNETFSQYLEKEKELFKYFVTFPVETKLHHRPIDSHHAIRVKLHTVADPKETLDCMKAHLTHYNEDQQHLRDTLTNIMFSEDVLCHVIRIHRVLCYHHCGSLVLIGAVGSHLTQLTRLALHLAAMRPFPIDTSRPTAFFDSLRTAVRVAGTEGYPVSVVLSARELQDPTFLDAINSLLVAGEYPHLFSNDELDGLLQVLTPTLRRHYPNMMSDPMKFFVSRVKCNLHIILILPPHHSLLREALQNYPGIVSETQVIWIRDWPQEVLVQQAEYFINHNMVAHDTSRKTREALTMAIANMHSLTLRDCKQTSWAGETNETVSVTATSLQTKKDKESIKVEKMEMPNLPYSKSILLERIKLMNKDENRKSSVEVFVGPYTYRKFMECLNQLYKKHSRILNHETTKLKRALETLEETRKDAKTMQKAIQVLRKQYNSSKAKVSDLFKQLTTEATRLEKLKAHFGTGGGSLHAFLQLTQEEDSDLEEDVLLRYEENDEYDQQFEAMREANLKSKKVQVDEDIASAKKDLEEARLSLATARSQVELWKSKVDRGCIERLKAFKKPPRLVAQVLEMVMILVGAQPWLIQSRGDQHSQGGREVKTPKNTRKSGDHADGSDKSESRVSSGSTLKTAKKQPRLSRQMTRTSTSSFAAAATSSKNESSVGRNKWKSMQNFMNDTVRFVEMIHGVDWETGLSDVIVQDVEAYLYKGKEGQEGVTGEGSLLLEQQATIQQKKGTTAPGITISAARYSSEDAAVLVEYVISIVEYTRRCGPLKQAMDYMQQLETEREKIQLAEIDEQNPALKTDDGVGEIGDDEDDLRTATSIEELTKDDVQRLQSIVNSLQEKYDEAVVKKHRLKDELQTSQERLRSAINTLENLKPLEESWKAEIDEIISNEELVTNCILASACLTYCGGMTSDARKRMTSFYTHVCKHYELPIPNKMLFNNYRLHEFLLAPLEIQKLNTKRLPVDGLTLDQTCLLNAEHATWCLVCDSVAKIIDWLKGYMEEKLVVVQYSDLRAQFETSLSEGNTLLVTYCDVNELAKDFRFREVFRHRREFHTSKTPFKIMVGDHEVECHPSFRLYLHTATLPQDVPPEVAAYTTLVYNQTTRDGVKTQLLDRFMRLEKPRLRDEWMGTQRDKMKNMSILGQLEDQLKEILAGDFRLLNDISVTKKLAEIKKQYDEATETQSKIDISESSIERAKEGFTQVALRGAVLYDVTKVMGVINPLYCHSWQRFVSLYDENIHQSERSALKVVCSEMTYNIYFTICQSLFEQDRLLFALLLALEVEDSNANVRAGEREFLISPDYAQAHMNALGLHPSESRSQAKKAFDWMTEEQYHNIQILAMYFDWFHDLFDRMPRDGREMQWRILCEGDSPESPHKCRLPDNADDYYTPLQRLLVIRALRNDRIVQASTEFIYRVLGKKFVRDEMPDLGNALKQSEPKTPIILLFSNENDLALRSCESFATKSGVGFEVVYINGCGNGEERKARKSLYRAIENGTWIILQNAQNNPTLVQSLYSHINDCASVSSSFRLWITCEASAKKLHTSILHTSIKLVVDTPKGMKDNLLRFVTTHLDSEVINSSSRPEWLPCLHNACLLHGAVRLRARLPSCVGWQQQEAFHDINSEQLSASIAVVTREFHDILVGSSGDTATNVMLRNISWSGLRYQIAELIYGNFITNIYDKQGLNALVDYWLASSSTKKEFELPRVKYRLPTVLFAQSVKQSSIVQLIDVIPQHQLDVAEACNLHPSSEAVLGDDQYIFTRLNAIYDFLPESSTLSHKLYPRPPTSMTVSPHTSISSTSSHPWVIRRGIFATHAHALLKSGKEVELWEVCYNALPKIPKSWSKEYVSERIRKLGGPTPFNLFIQNELKQLHKLLAEIKRSLISVKAAVESLDQFGDRLSDEDALIANDLSRSLIPAVWMELAGETAPPNTTPLSQWLNDIALRVAHFERILAVGKDKIAAYWLGAFFNPHALVSALKQEGIKNHVEKSGNVDNVVFHIEVTQRDKDHLRDPPSEGFFLHGVYLWGCTWDKTSGEMLDVPPKHGPASLPVIHVTFTTETAKYGTGSEVSKPIDYYSCPVFVTCTSTRDPVLELDVYRESVPSSRWALRGLTATIRPY
ncbi:unnamed protein product [Clavelina lepadiformis]|uniref:Uncharacterized protein n=1 Tax=Clavelina lepadiformis TaxID=159417 RepID=A0ABP0GTK2_CLALP